MTNPTSNYGFVLPTSTDLVTDLPADFEVALQGVDTRLKALQPGTTLGDIAYSSATANTNTRLPIGTSGQVLAVSGGGVPAWTTTADVTPLTTKGDLFTYTTADARLGVGTDGQTLVADSSTATGLKWATASSGAMTLITRQSFTSVANTGTTFDNIFTSTYETYLVVLEQFTNGTNAGDVIFQLRYAGPTTQTTTYYGNSYEVAFNQTALTFIGQSATSEYTMTSAGGDAGQTTSAILYFNKVGNSPGYRPKWYGSGAVEGVRTATFGGMNDTARIYTGLQFKSDSGNITGVISVYGLAK